MVKPLLVRLFNYRYRNVFGLLIFFALLSGALWLAWQVPGQLSQNEMQSAVKGATLSFSDPSAKDIINLPYTLLQKTIIYFLGLTQLSIKLPSLLLGAFTAMGILWLLINWLKRDSIALFTAIIAVTSTQFMFISSSGVPLIMPLFWTTALLLLALKLSANHTSLLWIAGAGAVVGLSLYTPLSVYLLIALFVAAFLHPHLRHLLRTIPKKNVALGLVVLIITIIPLLIALFKQPTQLIVLLGPSTEWMLSDIKFNSIELFQAFFAFWSPQLGALGLTPVFSIASLSLIVLGLLKLIVDHHSARSYSLAIIVFVMLAAIVVRPEYAVTLFLPFILLMAIGIEALLEEWYKLFPHNPYARVVALVPVVILLSSIIVSNITYYSDGYRYSPDLPRYYNNDLVLARQIVSKYPEATIITTESQQKFYDLLRREWPKISVTSDKTKTKTQSPVIIASGTAIDTSTLGIPTQIATNHYADSPPRFYVYTKP